MPERVPKFNIMPVGWDHSGWMGGFYPDDLPEDWRLAYFANEFSGVLITQVNWQHADVEQFKGWLDDVSDSFRFYLMFDSHMAEKTCFQAGEVLGESLGGFVIHSGSNHTDLAGLPVFVAKGLTDGFEDVAQLAIFVKQYKLGDLRAQRGWLETLVSKLSPEIDVPLFVGGSPPSIHLIRNLRQLAQLMGFA